MSYKEEVKRLAKELGARVCRPVHNPYDDSFQIDVEAPDGKMWSAMNSQVLVSIYYRYAGETEENAYQDLYYRMWDGLEAVYED